MSLFLVLVAFLFVIGASYVGTMLALRAYFEDEGPDLSEIVRIDEGDGD